MQVADNTQIASSATIGAQATRKVSMVEDASFFMMLSSNLYSNQKLAFVREVLCNAWDAHIDAGTTDQPVKITINSDYDLVIEDCGKGIPDDLIDQIYGTYGGSTKRDDNATTGGFGLGSKSPWAYVESFRVTSEHGGTKTVYNMARTCVENDGKPGITPVMSIPTDRTGLTVIIRLEQDDVSEITEYIKAIVLHGDMNATFYTFDMISPVRMKNLGMSFEPGSYNLDSDRWFFNYMGNHRVFIRYGAVVYPVLRTPATERAIEVIETFMRTVGYDRIVVQAAPSTLALTPSREALSSQKMTEDGIVDICVNLVDQIEKDILSKVPDEMVKLRKYVQDYNYAGMFGRKLDFWGNITDLVVQRYVRSKLGKAVRTEHHKSLWDIMVKGFYQYAKANFPREIARELIRANFKIINDKKSRHSYERQFMNYLSQKYIVKPLGKLICESNGLLTAKNLRLVMCGSWSSYVYNDGFSSHLDTVEDFKEIFGNKRIFVTTRIKDITKSVKDCPSVTRTGCKEWVIRVGTKAGEKDAAIQYLKDAGYDVIDLTIVNPWDSVAVALESQRKLKEKQKAKGMEPEKKVSNNILLSLQSVYLDNGTKDIRGGAVDSLTNPKKVTETPLFYMTNREACSDGQLGQFTMYQWLTEEERAHGIIVRNGIETNMAIKRGAIHVDDYFRQKFITTVLSPEYKKYMTKQRKRAVSDDHHIRSVDLKLLRLLGVTLPGYSKLFYHPVYEKHFGLLDSYSTYTEHSLGLITPEQTDALNAAKEFKLETLPFIQKIKAMKSDELLRHIGRSERIIKYLNTMPERKAALKSLVISALKNGKPSNE